ncbi:MAG: hypothetical protein QOE36_1759 [Gaiellaceae bacterium]|nr:hypothetical protein [Gaiellaceae bacterium]
MATRETMLGRRRRRQEPLSDRLVRWSGPFLVLCLVALLPWTLWLSFSLPSRHVSEHYGIAWTGFDLFLAATLFATAFAVVRRKPWLQSAAAVTGALLICDAWFDILSSQSDELAQAILLGLACELPLAALCFWISHNRERFFRQTDDLRRRARRALN